MQSGVHRNLYDGPISVEDLQALKPHASCYGKGCDRIAQGAEEDEMWRIIRGKPNCPECYRKKEDRKEAKQAREAAKEAASVAFVEEVSGGLITDDTKGPRLAKLLFEDSPDQTPPPSELNIKRPE